MRSIFVKKIAMCMGRVTGQRTARDLCTVLLCWPKCHCLLIMLYVADKTLCSVGDLYESRMSTTRSEFAHISRPYRGRLLKTIGLRGIQHI